MVSLLSYYFLLIYMCTKNTLCCKHVSQSFLTIHPYTRPSIYPSISSSIHAKHERFSLQTSVTSDRMEMGNRPCITSQRQFCLSSRHFWQRAKTRRTTEDRDGQDGRKMSDVKSRQNSDRLRFQL